MKILLVVIVLFILLSSFLALQKDEAYTGTPATSTALKTQESRDSEPVIITVPPEPVQGEPVLISVSGLKLSDISSLSVDGKRLGVFEYQGKPSALLGLDLRGRVGSYPINLVLSNGKRLESSLVVGEREIYTAPLGIPDKLGGNTPKAEQELISTLAKEAAIINAVPSTDQKLWDEKFRFPLDPPITITDTYGYSRKTGGSSISHKGTDFRAAVGTPVYAMNAGKVVYADFLRNYGHTIIIDHGFGLQTVYMHLSKRLVAKGDEVPKGKLIARSGDTGYVLGPHLHLSVRINSISIDPMKFLEIFGPESPRM